MAQEINAVPPQVGFDGSKIKNFVENENSFNQYVDKTFKSLDTNHKGTLSEKELTPIMGSLGEALGLPPKGTDKESDHIYDEVFEEFTAKDGVTKDTFKKVLREVYLGLADGLERDPINILSIDGSKLRKYAETGTFETDSVATFSRLDVKQDGNLQASKLIDALKSISVDKGMPPAGDPKMKDLVRGALDTVDLKADSRLDQYQFVDNLRKVVSSIADSMQRTPVEVAHSEIVYDGHGIVSFLKEKAEFQTALDEAWEKMPKDSKGRMRKDYIRVGVDELCPAAGLPPVGAVDEMDDVMKTVFSKIDLDAGGTVNKQEFDKAVLEVMGSMMLQLEGKPIAVNNSSVVSVSS